MNVLSCLHWLDPLTIPDSDHSSEEDCFALMGETYDRRLIVVVVAAILTEAQRGVGRPSPESWMTVLFANGSRADPGD